jgi:hypothetical protein
MVCVFMFISSPECNDMVRKIENGDLVTMSRCPPDYIDAGVKNVPTNYTWYDMTMQQTIRYTATR